MRRVCRKPFPNPDGSWSIPLTKGHHATIDEADIPLVEQYVWYALKNGNVTYAARTGRKGERKTVYLHRVITGDPAALQVDHINGDGLDNRRSNLRVCTNAQNARNQRPATGSSTGFLGVTMRPSGRFRAQIRVNGEIIRLGEFGSAEEAAIARDRASIAYFGEFARTNFPTGKAS